jgi:hypothetical protein
MDKGTWVEFRHFFGVRKWTNSHGDASFADWYQTSKHWISMRSMRMAKMFEKSDERILGNGDFV